MTRRRTRVAVSLVAIAIVAGACGGGEEDAGPPPATVGPDVELAVGTGLTLDPVSGYGALGPFEPIEGPDSCRGWRGSVVGDDRDDRIDIALWGDGCVATEGLNGQRVQYRTVADVVSGEVVETRGVPAGTATAIDDLYVECTNECNEYEDRIVLVELAEPNDPAFTSAMISTIDDVPFDELLAIAAALRVGATG